MKDNKTNRDTVAPIVKKIADALTTDGIVIGNSLIVSLAEIDGFLKVLDRKHIELNASIDTCRPARPPGQDDCKNCDFYAACMGSKVNVEEDE